MGIGGGSVAVGDGLPAVLDISILPSSNVFVCLAAGKPQARNREKPDKNVKNKKHLNIFTGLSFQVYSIF
jgi:hypothetical protein